MHESLKKQRLLSKYMLLGWRMRLKTGFLSLKGLKRSLKLPVGELPKKVT